MNDSLRIALTDIRHAITHEGLFLPDKARVVLLARIAAFLAAAPAPTEPDAAVRELVEALEEIRKEADARRYHFGNINDINFEPGIATEANRQVEAIDALIAKHAPAPTTEPLSGWHAQGGAS